MIFEISQIILFCILLIVWFYISAFATELIIKKLSSNCLDRIIFVFLGIGIYREYRERRIKEVCIECFIDLIPIVILYFIIYVTIYFLPSFIITWILLIIYCLLMGLTHIIAAIATSIQIILNVERYRNRFYQNQKKIIEKFYSNSFSYNEEYQRFKLYSLGPIKISLLDYFYNTTSDIMDGKILIKRKLNNVIKSYGVMSLIFPIILALIVSPEIVINSPVDLPTERLELVSTTSMNKQIEQATPIIALFVIGFFLGILPIIAGLAPEVTFWLDYPVNHHSKKCQCQEMNKKIAFVTSAIVESWEMFQKYKNPQTADR